jgi:asparagine synthase (glutamine-hydrolysing)
MCGICGIINHNRDEQLIGNLVGAMCDVMTHRGPDEEGKYIDEKAALGMRRLKIIDLSTGSQPIFNEDRSIVVVYNGEIYNYLELREDLEKKGHKFYSNTDTEVIVHLYEDYKEGFLRYLNGMFAIALWDNTRKKLILARDRMGEKPLYYRLVNDTLIFGSEIKCLLCYPGASKELDSEATYHYCCFRYVPSPLTIFKDIFKLDPAHYLTYHDRKLVKKEYWKLQFKDKMNVSENDIAERLYLELRKAVKYRLLSDVPLGAFLSGGIDSSIMVALMTQLSNAPVKTFSIGLEDEKSSELPFARAVAERYETEHYELMASPDAVDLLDQIAWHFDEPFADGSALPTFLVSLLTKKYVTVAISGDGGDELFGGYERYRRILKRSFIQKMPKKLRKAISKHIGAKLPYGFKGQSFLQSLQNDNYFHFTIGNSKELSENILSSDFAGDSYKFAEKFLLKGRALIEQCMYYDLKVYLPDDILTKVDRMSMANSLETRAPFLDHNFVEFCMAIPHTLKINNGVTKYILKKTFKKHLPEKVYTHKKTGFRVPIETWFRNELKPLVMDYLSKENC